MAMALGTTAQSLPRRETTPPSWSMAMKAGWPVLSCISACSWSHSALV